MAKIVLAEALAEEVDRIFEIIAEHDPNAATARIAAIIESIDILEKSPLIGRPVDNGKRELIIAAGTSGYIALYRYAPEIDTVFVLALRSQREAGYGREIL